tara:strand:+ start:896 stop:1216 length:321 start_codon:yes stop_codon:yes gene_type:complete
MALWSLLEAHAMPKQVSRAGETPKTWFRTERVFLSAGQWFFHTREGVDVGPYESQFEAEIEAGMLKELLREHGQGDGSLSIIREFVLDSYAMGRPLAPSINGVAAV